MRKRLFLDFRSSLGFVDHPDGFQIDRYDLDVDNWTEGFITVVTVEVPLRDTEDTVAVCATWLASGNYQLWVESEITTERWLFKPNQTVRCEVRRSSDGIEHLFAVELVAN